MAEVSGLGMSGFGPGGSDALVAALRSAVDGDAAMDEVRAGIVASGRGAS